MFNFGNTAYSHLGVEKARKPQASDAWARAEGDVDTGAQPGAGGKSSDSYGGGGSSMGAESGRVQVPIGTVSDSQHMRLSQTLALLAFAAVNAAAFVGLAWLALTTTGAARIAAVAVGGGAWLFVLLFNVRMAARPRRIIQRFLQAKAKTRLGRRLGSGQTVVVKGVVSLLHEELLSTEFHNVPGLVLVESSLRSYYPGLRKADAWTEHVRQTRAVDFRITDAQTGMSAIVKAFHAAETGVATPLVHISTEVPLSASGAPVGAGAAAEAAEPPQRDASDPDDKKRRRKPTAPQLMVCKGYIRQGQTIVVMGALVEEPGSHELLIEPLAEPRNIAKLLLFRGFLPFFFPTWAAGLIISDQRDLA